MRAKTKSKIDNNKTAFYNFDLRGGKSLYTFPIVLDSHPSRG